VSTPQTGTQPPDRRAQRLLSYSGKNMIYSLLAVLVVAFAVWALMPSPESLQRRPVEIDSVAAYAAEQSAWPVWVPQGQGEEWTPTRARFGEVVEVQTWRMGWVSPAGEYVALDQAADITDGWRAAVLDGAEQQGTRSVTGPTGGQEWQLWIGEEETHLVLPAGTGDTPTTVVHGTAAEDELVEFIGYLEPYQP
jgi:hypothetical protein